MPSACDSHVLGGVDDWYMLFLMTPEAYYGFLRALLLIVVPTWHREASCARAAPPLPHDDDEMIDDAQAPRNKLKGYLARLLHTPSIAAEVDFFFFIFLIDFESDFQQSNESSIYRKGYVTLPGLPACRK
jgi:hypothetical protein